MNKAVQFLALPWAALKQRPAGILFWAALAVLPPQGVKLALDLDWRTGLMADVAWTPLALACQIRLLILLGENAGLPRPGGGTWRPFRDILGANFLMGLRLAVTAQAGLLPALLALALLHPGSPSSYPLLALLALAGLVPALRLLYLWIPVPASVLWRGLGPVQALDFSSAALKGTFRRNLGLLALFTLAETCLNLPDSGFASVFCLPISLLLETSLIVVLYPE